jgi:hypothetical protein
LVIWQVDDDPVHLFLAARLIRRANPTAEIVSFENAREAAEKLALEMLLTRSFCRLKRSNLKRSGGPACRCLDSDQERFIQKVSTSP